MYRRAVLVAAAAVVVISAPTVAMAHAPAGFSVTVVDPTPAVGVPFTVHASGARASEEVTLTMTRNPASTSKSGTRSMTKKANASGEADFAVALTEDGIWELVSTSASGAVLGRQSVTVADKGTIILDDAGAVAGADTATAAGTRAGTAAGAHPGTAAGTRAGTAAGALPGTSAGTRAATAAGPRAGTAAGGQLSNTGFQGMGLVTGGGGLVLIGAGAVLAGSRRKSARVSGADL